MLTAALGDLVLWVLDAVFELLAGIVPTELLGWVEDLPSNIQPFMSFTPVTAVFGVLAANWLLTMGVQAFGFVVECYRLIPAKAS